MRVRHRSSGCVGDLVKVNDQQVTLSDLKGREQVFPNSPGAFSVDGSTVTLIRPKPTRPTAPTETASGSVPAADTRARVARGSRILVEGIHDAELVEKVWGDDLRAEGVVVEPLHGADDLAAIVREFAPSDDRRLGILLDHYVPNTKEWYIAQGVDSPHVLITGHPFVDVWQAIQPGVIGIEAWPEIPKGTDWKTGICKTFGFGGPPAQLWTILRNKVSSYRDLEPALVGAVEELIDFVAPPPEI